MLNSTKIARKKRLNEEQVRVLEASFDYNKNLEGEMKVQLADELGVPPRQIAIWYQNKRARWKTQSLQIAYNALQSRLDDALLEKKQLEKQVKHLKQDLQKARDDGLLLMADKQQQYLPLSSISSCGDEGAGGSGGLEGGGGGGGGTTNLHDGESLYAWLFTSGQASSANKGDYCDLRWQNDDSILSCIFNSNKV